MEPELLALLALAGLLAGFFDSIVGGGGVVTLPAFLAAGLPPHAAVATNKVAGTGASTMATANYWRAGLIDGRLVRRLMPLAALGSVAGAATLLRIPERAVLVGVLTVTLAMTAYILLRPRLGEHPRPISDWGAIGLLLMAPVVGFYDGLLGPGTGNMLLFGFLLAGCSMLTAAAHGRALNMASNVAALAFFMAYGSIAWLAGLAAAGGTVTGSYAGSRLNIQTEAKWVRPMFALVAFSLVLRLV